MLYRFWALMLAPLLCWGTVQTTKYCIDEGVQSLFQRRLSQCGVTSISNELAFLHAANAIEYQRGSHELLAYQWLVQGSNPHRVANCSEADLEYIPLLPLHWRVGTLPSCTYQALIELITTYVAMRNKNAKFAAAKFAVASTFNLRTNMGSGMQQQVRRGQQYDEVTTFVQSLYLGHYERWPQCPDLLRKGWRGVVELPYVALGEKLGGAVAAAEAAPIPHPRHRPTLFFFSGRINQLYGPELVCSVRTTLAALSRTRNDLRIVNITNNDLSRGVQQPHVDLFASSVFCLITKADSYSSGTFYTAIQSGCIPVVISDWFVFAFPWVIPYASFVTRFSEAHWLMDPNACLDHLSKMPESSREARRAAMRRYSALLKFEPLPASSVSARRLQALWISEQRLQTRSPDSTPPTEGVIVLPLQLFLFELHVLSQNLPLPLAKPAEVKSPPAALAATTPPPSPFGAAPHQTRVFSCDTPFHCASNVTDFSGTIAPPTFMAVIQNTRSYFCTHAHRLIGLYKMVYFQGCVRILWPLRPGFLKPQDIKNLSPQDKTFVEHFHNVSSRPPGYLLFPYPSLA